MSNFGKTISPVIVILSIIYLIYCLFDFGTIYHRIVDGDTLQLTCIFIAIFCFVVFSLIMNIDSIREKNAAQISQIEAKTAKTEEKLKKEYIEKEKSLKESIDKKELDISQREKMVKGFLVSLDKEKYCAELISDFRTVMYDKAVESLLVGRFPAPKSANVVMEAKDKANSAIRELKNYKYKEKERIDAIEREAELKIKNALYDRDKICRAMDALKAKMESSTPFKEVAELYADALAEAYGTIAQELRNRIRPANVRADVIERELRQKIRETTIEAKLQKYRWSFLLSIYPELENYVFEDESLISMAEHESMDKFQNNRDAALDFLSIEEYETLSDTEKYQLSLDRYKSSHRQNAWIAGVEYELYCCYILRKNGYYVIENGVRMRKEDMGRDIP